MVVVPKAGGSLRLCGDYKVTVNQAIHTEQYPMPTTEQIRSMLAGGKKFTKIDLRCAYQQLLLDEKSQELCTNNTPKGLFKYTRLPFRISSSPAIFQRYIEQVTAGLDGVCVIQDDLSLTDDEHIQNLEAVLKRFMKYGVWVKYEKCAFMQAAVVYYVCIF